MEYSISIPSPSLSHLVKHYWTMETCLARGRSHIQRIVPNGLPELIFYFGDRPESENKNLQLEDRLCEEPTFDGRIRIAEKFLHDCIQRSEKKWHQERMIHGINLISKTLGMIGIERLASETCFSRKQFERIFAAYIGTSPKKFIRTVRFQHAIRERSFCSHLSMTDLTYRCGYYDQSHMINDFQKLSGMSPKRYFAECTPHSDYFQG